MIAGMHSDLSSGWCLPVWGVWFPGIFATVPARRHMGLTMMQAPAVSNWSVLGCPVTRPLYNIVPPAPPAAPQPIGAPESDTWPEPKVPLRSTLLAPVHAVTLQSIRVTKKLPSNSMHVSISGCNALCAVCAASGPPEAGVEVRGPGCSTFLHKDDTGEAPFCACAPCPVIVKSCQDELPLSMWQTPSEALLQACAHLHCTQHCKPVVVIEPDCDFLGSITTTAQL